MGKKRQDPREKRSRREKERDEFIEELHFDDRWQELVRRRAFEAKYQMITDILRTNK